ncbi:MAG: 16S rRNA (uracil(1498)-N(3))-methyltransferase, partial [Clostridia bacterium]|nr:16S rRNA (uracil(1498)-N(3))-methyltransferase [Clostridia bacterium]
MRRFFLEKTAFEGETVVLTGDEARHVFTVLRMRPGDEVLLINGEGVECVARIGSASNEAVSLSILESRICSADPFVCVTLFQCLPKQGKMEVIIQKCVELGVFAIVPTVSKRCVVKPEGMDKKLVRWNKVSQEAAKQCGRANVPKVTEALYLDKADFSGYDTVMAAYENESERTLKSALRSLQGSKNIAI